MKIYLIIGSFLTNIGMITLVQALSTTAERTSIDSAEKAEQTFLQALAYHPHNFGSQRGLIFSLFLQEKDNEVEAMWRVSEDPKSFLLLAMGLIALEKNQQNRAKNLWSFDSDMTDIFLQAGDKMWSAGYQAQSSAWYELGTVSQPQLADAWYFWGRSLVISGQWRKAIIAYDQAAQAQIFHKIGQSSPLCAKGWVLDNLAAPQDRLAALAAYDAGIIADDYADDDEALRCHFYRGQNLFWTNPDEAIAEFEFVLSLDNEFVMAHVLLGRAYFYHRNDLHLAEKHIQKAMELEPQNQWSYFFLGTIYQDMGYADRARQLLTQSLLIDPGLQDARQRLDALRTEQ